MATILDGKTARDSYKKALIQRVARLNAPPRLSIIQIGDNKESAIYIDQKKKFGEAIGAAVELVKLSKEATFEEASAAVRKESDRADVDGVILQSPLPHHLDFVGLVNLIDPEKDVDGLSDDNQRLLEEGRPRFVPATAKGVKMLLDFYRIPVKGRKAAVLGRSRLVGHPIAETLKRSGAIVSVCHSKTEDVKAITRDSDIVVSAIGKPNHIDSSFIKEGAILLDVGINSLKGEKLEEELPKRKIVGDARFDDVLPHVSAISPVPGGVGPMTVLSLFDNLVEAAERKAGL